jgi:HEAT repeat protein
VPKVTPKPVMAESRPPTLRERLLVGDMRPSKEKPTTAPAAISPPPPRDAQTLAALALEETEPRRQRQIVAELIQSSDPSALGLYLQLVVDRSRRDVALDALADVKDPPVQALIEELSNSRVAIRFAAARVLGRIDGPVTTEQLVYLIQRNTQRREALAALLYSGGPDASAFLSNARNVPALAGTVRAVEIQLKSVQ